MVFLLRLNSIIYGISSRKVTCMPRRKTHIEYKNELTSKYGSKYVIKSSYINTKTKITFYCNECLSEHIMIAQHLLNNGCSLCGRKLGALKNTLSEEEFQERLRHVHGEKIINKDPYIKRDVKIKFFSNICKHEWEATPDAVLSGNGCNVCALVRSIKTRTKTHEAFLKEVYDLVADDYSLIEKYIKIDIKIRFKHNNCDKEFLMTPHSFLSGHRCPHCFGTPKKSTEQFKNEVFQLVGDDYEILSDYKGNKINVTFRHLNCKNGGSYTFKMRPNSFLLGQRCPNCRPNKKDTQESFKEKLLKIKGEDYKLISDYANNWTKVHIQHRCGYKWSVTPNNILNGQDCPFCFKMQEASRGERRIIEYLNGRKIDFTIEATFPNLKYKKKLRFDIAASINETAFLIEYHGIQHYEPVDYFGGEAKFKKQKEMDKMKEQFVRENDIPLIVIPYWDYENIEIILNDALPIPAL
jgi:hypothetical protein